MTVPLVVEAVGSGDLGLLLEANNTSIRQVRHHRYQEIADSLRRRVEAGEFVAGGLLPSEADLVARYKASRVTVRRALEDLRAEGLVDSRQGSGWFVATDPLPQNLGRLGTIEDQLLASGRTSERRILDFAFVPAPPDVAEGARGDDGLGDPASEPGRR